MGDGQCGRGRTTPSLFSRTNLRPGDRHAYLDFYAAAISYLATDTDRYTLAHGDANRDIHRNTYPHTHVYTYLDAFLDTFSNRGTVHDAFAYPDVDT
jgi:hypothetical protein